MYEARADAVEAGLLLALVVLALIGVGDQRALYVVAASIVLLQLGRQGMLFRALRRLKVEVESARSDAAAASERTRSVEEQVTRLDHVLIELTDEVRELHRPQPLPVQPVLRWSTLASVAGVTAALVLSIVWYREQSLRNELAASSDRLSAVAAESKSVADDLQMMQRVFEKYRDEAAMELSSERTGIDERLAALRKEIALLKDAARASADTASAYRVSDVTADRASASKAQLRQNGPTPFFSYGPDGAVKAGN